MAGKLGKGRSLNRDTEKKIRKGTEGRMKVNNEKVKERFTGDE